MAERSADELARSGIHKIVEGANLLFQAAAAEGAQAHLLEGSFVDFQVIAREGHKYSQLLYQDLGTKIISLLESNAEEAGLRAEITQLPLDQANRLQPSQE